MEQQLTVRRFYDEDGRQFVAFLEHEGYFELTDAAQKPAIEAALAERRQVTVAYDLDLRVLSVT